MTRRRACIAVAVTMMVLSLADCTAENTGNEVPAATQEAAMTESDTDTQASEAIQETVVAGQTGADTATNVTITLTDDLDSQISVEPTDHATVLSGSFAQAWMLAGGQLDAVTEDVYSERDMGVPDTAVDLGMLRSPNAEALIGNGAAFVMLSTSIEKHVALRDTLEKAEITTAYFDMETFEDYLGIMKICTDITGRADLCEEQGANLEAQTKEQIARADGGHPTVLFLRAFSTRVKAKGSDNMTGQILKDLGCVNIADSDKALLDDLNMESIIAQDPDYIFVTTMESSDETAMRSVEDMLLSNPVWKELSTVKNDRYHVFPKALFHNKPSNRWRESYQMLADILYGENKSESN